MVILVKHTWIQASESGDAFAIVERLEGQIAREENKIEILEDRILGIGGTVDVSESNQTTGRTQRWCMGKSTRRHRLCTRTN